MNKKAKSAKRGDDIIARNPKAERSFDVEERIECGIVLTGSEVKSLRSKHADLEGAYAAVENMELFVFHMYIGPYEQAGRFGHEERRKRKLLVHKREIERLTGKVSVRGYALIPAKLYWKEGRAKLELVLGKGRKQHDEREAIRRELDLKEARAAMSRARKG